jgi:hypothetical protein
MIVPTPVPIFSATPAPAVSESATLQRAVDAAAERAAVLSAELGVTIVDPATGAHASYDADLSLPVSDEQLRVLGVRAIVIPPNAPGYATADLIAQRLLASSDAQRIAYAHGIGFEQISGHTYLIVALERGANDADFGSVLDALSRMLR